MRSGWALLRIGLYAVCAALPFGLAWSPLPVSLVHLLSDDCFYYLRVAENVLEGRGASFDGSAATNGFHPLWMLVCIGLRAVAGREVVVHLLLSVAALLHLGQAFLLHGLVKERGSRLAADALAFFFLTNFRILTCNLSGLETPLSLFGLLLVVRALVRGEPSGAASSARLGALLGLAVLARFDLLLLALAVLAMLAPLRGPGARKRARVLASASVSLLVLLAPWAVWSLQHSGTLLPNSGAALRLWLFRPPELGLTLAENLARLAQQLRVGASLLPDTANVLGLWPGAALPGVAALPGGLLLGSIPLALLLKALVRPPRTAGPPGPVRWIAGWAAAHFLYYALFARPEVRYLMPFCLVVLLIAAWELAAPGSGLRRRSLATVWALAWLNVAVSGGLAWQREERSGRQVPDADLAIVGPTLLYEAAGWIAQHTRESDVVGAFNAGILGYYSGRTTVNLDGVMNDEALAALRERRLAAYLERREVRVLVDFQGEILRFMYLYGGDPGWRRQFRLAHRLGPSGALVILVRTRLDASHP